MESERLARRVTKRARSWELYRRLAEVLEQVPDAFPNEDELFNYLHGMGYTYDPEVERYFYRLMDVPDPLTGWLYDGVIPPSRYADEGST